MIDGRKLRFGLVGAGGIANAYSAAMNEMPLGEFVAIVDSNMDAANAFAATHDAVVVDSVDDLTEANVDAVIIATPPLYHPEQCVQLLSNGTHVLCEKPLAINSSCAVTMLEAAKTGNAIFTMASKFRFVDDINFAKRMLDDGQLGDIVLYENCFTGVVDMSQRWNSDPKISGGGVLIDNGTHSLDIMRFFLGELAEIQVIEGNRIQDLPVEDTVHVFVRSKSGTIGSIDLSWSMHKDIPYFVSLYGSLGTVQIGWQSSRYKLSGDKEWTNFGTGYNKIASFRNQLENFAGAIVAGKPLVITPEDGLASVCAVEAAYEAMRESQWQPVPPKSRIYSEKQNQLGLEL